MLDYTLDDLGMPGNLATMVQDALLRELEELRDQVRALAQPLNEHQFWIKPIHPGNSFGHLVLHLTGNLSHFVGAQLGATGFVRDREREFTEPTPLPKDDALAALDDAVAVCRRVVAALGENRLCAPHPTERLGTTVNALVHLVAHFALHRGQMSYITRLVENTTTRA